MPAKYAQYTIIYMNLQNFILLLCNIALVVSGQTLIKQGMNKIGNFSAMPFVQFLVKSFMSPFVVIGIGLYVISAIIWLMLLSRINLSVAYPSLSLGYLLILFISWFYLRETVTPYQLAGVFLIIAGIYLVMTKTT